MDQISASFLPTAPPSSFWLPQIRSRRDRQQEEHEQEQQEDQDQQQLESCSSCNGYYGPSFGQPVCATCHAFLHANDLDVELNMHAMTMAHGGPDDVEGGVGGAGGDGAGAQDGDGGGEHGEAGAGGGGGGGGAGAGGDDSDRDSGNEDPLEDVVENAQPEDEGNVDDEGDEIEIEMEDGGAASGGHNSGAEEAAAADDNEDDADAAGVDVLPPVAVAAHAELAGADAAEFDGGGAVAAAAAAGGPQPWPSPPGRMRENLMLPWDMRPSSVAAATAMASIKVETLSQRLAMLAFPRPSDKYESTVLVTVV